MKFQDRVDAGKQLAQKLMKYKNSPNTIVLGLPRGGVVVAREVATMLGLPMDIKIVRKISTPSNPALVVGALTASGTIYLNEQLMKTLGITIQALTPIIETEQKEALRRLNAYTGARKPLEIKDKTVILVDDGIATGATMHAAIESVKLHGAKKIIVATPVASSTELNELKFKVDELVCLAEAINLSGIWQAYENFPPVTDDEVVHIMNTI